MKEVNNLEVFGMPRGRCSLVYNITTGPIVMEVSYDNGTTWQNLTDGSFAATGDSVIIAGKDNKYRATIPSGDVLAWSTAERG